ncbi:hypothetical protein FRC10_004045, partial [Ceratobasidium sp. 414]
GWAGARIENTLLVRVGDEADAKGAAQIDQVDEAVVILSGLAGVEIIGNEDLAARLGNSGLEPVDVGEGSLNLVIKQVGDAHLFEVRDERRGIRGIVDKRHRPHAQTASIGELGVPNDLPVAKLAEVAEDVDCLTSCGCQSGRLLSTTSNEFFCSLVALVDIHIRGGLATGQDAEGADGSQGEAVEVSHKSVWWEVGVTAELTQQLPCYGLMR